MEGGDGGSNIDFIGDRTTVMTILSNITGVFSPRFDSHRTKA